jgi:hypothetical protein
MRPDLAMTELNRSIETGATVYAVHYACEGFSDAKDRPAGVSAIAVRPIGTGQSIVYSLNDYPPATAADPRDPETRMLSEFLGFLREHEGARLVHWNMDAGLYGFAAIVNRYAYISGVAPRSSMPAEDRLFNLDDLLIAAYGKDYVQNPRLKTLLALNGIATRYSLSGEEQATRYREGDYGALARCTEERAGNIGELVQLFVNGRLQTERSGPAVRFAERFLESVSIVTAIAERTVLVGAAIRTRHGGRNTLALGDEYDYQDLYRGLLRLFFDDVQPEEWVPSYAGATSRVDFVLRGLGVAIELKVATATLGARQVGEQLLIDIGRYHAINGIRHLVCLVFDVGHFVDNPRGLESDLSKPRDGIGVTVRILD